MSAPDFLGCLIDCDNHNIPRSLLDHIEDPMFTPEAVARRHRLERFFARGAAP